MEEFFELVDIAIAFNKTMRAKLPADYDKCFLASNFNRQFSTVRLDVGRGVGKTSYIKKRVGENDLVIVPFSSQVRHNIQDGCRNVMKAHEIVARGVRLPLYDTIFIDEPGFLGEDVIKLIYERTSFSKDQTYVLLG